MAKETTIKINIDGSQAKGEIKSIDKELDKLRKDQEAAAKKVEKLDQEIYKERKKLIKETEKEQKEASKARIKELQNEKKEYQDLGDTVVQEIEKIQDAQADTKDGGGGIVESFSEAPGIIGFATQSVQGFGVALKALAANPIILVLTALVGALKFVYDAFTSTEDGANQVSTALAFLRGLIQPLIDGARNIGQVLIDAFTNPKQALLDFANSIKENIINRFTGLLELIPNLGKAISLLFEGEFAEAGKVAADAVGKVVLGVENITEVVEEAVESVKQLGEAAIAAAEASAALEKSRQALIKLERENQVLNAKALRDIEALKNIRDDETQSIKDRQAANERIAKIEDARIARETKAANLRIANAEKEIQLRGASSEALDELAEAETALFELQNESLGIQNEQITNRVGLLREEAEALNVLIDLEQEKVLAFIDGEAEALAQQIKFQQQRIDNFKKLGLEQTQEFKDALAQQEILNAQFNRAILDQDRERLEELGDIEEAAIERRFELLEAAEEDRLALLDLADSKAIELADNRLSTLESQKAKELEIAGDNAAERIRIEQEYADQIKEVNADLQQELALNEIERNKQVAESVEERLDTIKDGFTQLGDEISNVISSGIRDISDSFQTLSTTINTLFNPDDENSLLNQIKNFSGDIKQLGSTVSQVVSSIAASVTTVIGDSIQKKLDDNLTNIENNFASQEVALQESLARREITEEEFEEKRKSFERQRESAERAAKLKAFRQNKALGITNAVIQTALGVTNALGSAPPPISFITAGLVGALGAAQIGIISSQKAPAFARGGLVLGQGTGTSDSINARLSNGESVINQQSTRAFGPLLSLINEAGGGRPIVPDNQNNFLQPTAQGNAAFAQNAQTPVVKAYVSEVDITDTQSRVNRVKENSTF